MKRTLTVPERLIIDVDSNLGRGASLNPISKWLRYRGEVLNLADGLMGTGVCFKMGPILRACGYQLIEAIHERGLRVCADLNLNSSSNDLEIDGHLLREANPEMVTVACTSGAPAIRALKALMPTTEVLGVAILPNLSDDEVGAMYSDRRLNVLIKLASIAEAGGVDGFMCTSAEALPLRSLIVRPMSYNALNVCPLWAKVWGYDQNPTLSVTPADAFRAGADRVVVSGSITNPHLQTPLDAIKSTLDEINQAV